MLKLTESSTDFGWILCLKLLARALQLKLVERLHTNRTDYTMYQINFISLNSGTTHTWTVNTLEDASFQVSAIKQFADSNGVSVSISITRVKADV